ncbi:FRG domain-containing protein [Microbulbifer sp. HZ11]|uniref:FRG domain-containing protein n=1 Tax=Microbulbifer sp. HZ11 TaxID=1453501 RepID=UPI0009DCC098|nr:FRG domain-containing protein [Microbulbifer sp. HZ11]
MEEIYIENWSEILDLEVEFPLDYFRGQSCADWPISSALQRLLSGSDYEDDPCNLEYWMLREFKRGAGRYLEETPPKEDLVTWFSLMQHYGAPTRLVDFTSSFYVACYFALSGAKSDAAIWSINPFLGFDIVSEVFGTSPHNELRDKWDDHSTQCGNDYLNSVLESASTASQADQKLGVIAVEPYEQHTRIGIQQGIFLMPLDISVSFMENITPYLKDGDGRLKKIIIRENVIETGLAHLKAMNITSETLFPGIEGFAKSIAHKCLNKN